MLEAGGLTRPIIIVDTGPSLSLKEARLGKDVTALRDDVHVLAKEFDSFLRGLRWEPFPV